MKATHRLEDRLAGWLADRLLRRSWRDALREGERLGELAYRLGIRRRVAEANLARAFPDWDLPRREAVLREHYRELGRVVSEYARLPELVRAPEGEVVAQVEGVEHLEAVRAGGRGGILMSGHYGNFELLGVYLSRFLPIDFVVKPLSNPAVERRLTAWREAAGMTTIPIQEGARRIFAALRENRCVGMLADQDARGDGVFVTFLGQPSSTPVGPAQIALRTGAPIVMGFIARRPDGRHAIRVLPPLEVPEPGLLDRTRELTARHAECLEARIRERPEMWFWLHRRWKTRPPAGFHPTPAAASLD